MSEQERSGPATDPTIEIPEQHYSAQRLRKDLLIGGLLVLVMGAVALWYFGATTETGDGPITPEPVVDRTSPAGSQSGTESGEVEQRRPRRRLEAPIPEVEWEPQIDLTPTTSAGDNAAALIADAQTDIDEGRLIAPPGENAIEKLIAVLADDAENEQAQSMVADLTAQLLPQADGNLSRDEVVPAIRILSALERANPGDEGVLRLRQQIDRIRRVADLLVAAVQDYNDGRLTIPAGSNALENYRAVLEIEPDHRDAQQGIAQIEQELITQAIDAARELNFDRADSLLASAEQVNAGGDGIESARTQIQEFRDQRVADLVGQARRALDEDRIEDAEELIGTAQAISEDGEGIAELRNALDLNRVYSVYRPGQVFSDPFSDGSGNGPRMIPVPLGSFNMGSSPSEAGRVSNEGPQRNVTFNSAFALGRNEVTVGEFRQFAQEVGYQTDAERQGYSLIYDESTGRIGRENRVYWIHDFHGDRADDDLPVVHVSWNDARDYVNWLANKTAAPYRLPSEAELAYAIRGGTQSRYWWGNGNPPANTENVTGDGERSSSRRSWTNAFEDYNDQYWGPAPVGSFTANPFGLFDIGGNVSEWVEDCWHDSYARAPTDGSAWVNAGCERRVVRGASWASSPDRARSAYRLSALPTTHGGQLGFRVARSLRAE